MKKLFLDGSKLNFHLPRVVSWLNGEQIYPIHVEISPSSGCNHRCILCCVDYKEHKFKNLNKELMLRLVDDFKEANVKSVLLAGEGEPLLNKYSIDMCQKAEEAKIDTALTTNGILLTPEVSNKILNSLSWIRFSVQAPEPKKYAEIHQTSESDYDKLIKNIEYAVKLKKEKNLKCTIGIQQILINENYDLILDAVKWAKRLGVNYYTVKRFSKFSSNSYDVPEDLYKKSIPQFEEAEKLADENFSVIIRWNQFANQPRVYKRCRGIPFISQILADGGVYPCCQFYGKKEFCLGNLYEKKFKEIFNSGHAQKILKFIAEEFDLKNCMTYCRHHSTNMFLDNLMNEPQHVNFI